MAQFFRIHPDNPQPRLIRQTVEILNGGGLIIYPTDSCYALGCRIGDKAAMDRIRRIRQLDDHHNFTLVCRDLAEISAYARVDSRAYRLIKAMTPGPFTFILTATGQVPRRLRNPKRKTIGLRVPGNKVANALLAGLGAPLMSSTLLLPGEELPLTDPEEMMGRLGQKVDLVIDGGYCGFEPTTVVELMGSAPTIARYGKGDTGFLGVSN